MSNSEQLLDFFESEATGPHELIFRRDGNTMNILADDVLIQTIIMQHQNCHVAEILYNDIHFNIMMYLNNDEL